MLASSELSVRTGDPRIGVLGRRVQTGYRCSPYRIEQTGKL